MKRRSGADAVRDMALGSRSLVSGLQIFGVLAVAVIAAAFAPLLLPGPRSTSGSGTPPAAATAVVSRVVGVEATPAAPVAPPAQAVAPDRFADSTLAIASANETAAVVEARAGRDATPSDLRRLPRPNDEPAARRRESKHTATAAHHDNGRRVRAHGRPSGNEHATGPKPAKAHGHGPKPKKQHKKH
jgi:hypothetical protein